MVYHYFVSYQFQSDDGMKSGFGFCQIHMNQKLETFEHVKFAREEVNKMLADKGLKNPSSVILNWKELKSDKSEGAQAENSESLSKEA